MQNLEAIMGALGKRGMDIETIALTRRWYVWLSMGDEPFKGATIRDLHENVIGFLAALEDEGVTEFHSDPWLPSSRPQSSCYQDSPWTAAHPPPSKSSRAFRFFPPGTAGMAGAEALVKRSRLWSGCRIIAASSTWREWTSVTCSYGASLDACWRGVGRTSSRVCSRSTSRGVPFVGRA